MHRLFEYDLIIFDCDGVIFDSNFGKIKAMQSVLIDAGLSIGDATLCSKYFSENFGKSRFHHVDYFVKNFKFPNGHRGESLKKSILTSYSDLCKEVYLAASITPGLLAFLHKFKGVAYVASGSEQAELRSMFVQRNLFGLFEGIFGSPTAKKTIVERIIALHPNAKAVLIGDAFADLFAARENNVDFLFFAPFSTVRSEMMKQCDMLGYQVLEDFCDL